MQSLKKLSDEIEKTKDSEAIKKAEKFFYKSIANNLATIFKNANKDFFGICQNSITNFDSFTQIDHYEKFDYYERKIDYSQFHEENDYFCNKNFLDIQFNSFCDKDKNTIEEYVRVPASEKEIAKICLFALQNPKNIDVQSNPNCVFKIIETINNLSDSYYYEIKDNEIYYKPRNNKELIKGIRDLKNEDYNNWISRFRHLNSGYVEKMGVMKDIRPELEKARKQLKEKMSQDLVGSFMSFINDASIKNSSHSLKDGKPVKEEDKRMATEEEIQIMFESYHDYIYI